MAIHYRSITLGAEPSSPEIGEIWINQIGGGYQAYIWLGIWAPFAGGGTYIAEPDADTHYVNVVVQEAAPNDFIQPGWIWIKESIKTAYLYIGNYITLASA